MASYMEPSLYEAVHFPSWVIMPTSQSEGEGSKNGSERGTISPACTACRERHLKCDGGQPMCSRCLSTQQECQYVRSRRGHRPPRKRKGDSSQEQSTSLPRDGQGPSLGDGCHLPADINFSSDQEFYQPIQLGAVAIQNHETEGNPNSEHGGHEVALSGHRAFPDTQIHSGHTSHKLQELYYHYFHDAHPILIPQDHFNEFSSSLPRCILAIMDYIGASFSAYANRCKVSTNLEANMLHERSGHTVQALLLLAIAQHSMDVPMQACQTLNSAIDMALELGMNRNSFRCDCCRDSPILRESWRRTWWELYVFDGMLAAVHMKPSFRLHTQEADVALPCEESEYRAGVKHERDCIFLRDMEETAFLDDDVTFSSYAYRITAIRELGNLLTLNRSFCPDSSLIANSVDAVLTNWLLHLPESKMTPIDVDGRLDEMMFQAHMIVNAALIFLHRPRSDLIFTSVKDTTSCTPARRIAVPASRYTVHTAKAVEAADRIANLVTLPGQVIKHTPMFTCMVTLAAVVHLSAYVITRNTELRILIKERLTLSIGALKTVREIWQVADSVLQRVRMAAREIMTLKKPEATQMVATTLDPDLYDLANSDLWNDGLQDPLFNEIASIDAPGHGVDPSLFPPQNELL